MSFVSATFFNASDTPEFGSRRASRNRRRAGGSPPAAVQRIADHRAINKRPGDVEEARPRRRSRRSRRWGQAIEVGENIRIQTRNGRRAAMVPIREGLWLLGDLDEATLAQMERQAQASAEIGFAPVLLLAPMLIDAALKGLAPEIAESQAAPTVNRHRHNGLLKRLLGRAVPQLTGPTADIGCGGSSCHCGG